MINNHIVCKNTKKFQLNKQSSEQELKNYFNAVLELANSDNEFPINLDDVYPLVYERKDSAVKPLKENFIEDVDYKLIRQKVEQVSGGKWVDNYYLTISCLEFFIARKVRAVFEVYRQVFHGVVNGTIPMYQVNSTTQPQPLPLKDQLSWAKEVQKMLKLNDASTLGMLQKIAQPYNLPLPDYTPSKGILKSASELLKVNGLTTVSSRHFNILMQDKGYIENVSRKSTGGKDKYFKSITKKGLVYGENQVSPHNPKETQPLYYVDKFPELLKELSLL